MAADKDETTRLKYTLSQNIDGLRKDFQQIVEKYRVNVEAELVNCMNLLSSSDADDIPAALTDPKQIEFINQALQSLSYKAEKGRMKDLRKIHYFVKMLAARISE